jgi:hypothetical protein
VEARKNDLANRGTRFEGDVGECRKQDLKSEGIEEAQACIEYSHNNKHGKGGLDGSVG